MNPGRNPHRFEVHAEVVGHGSLPTPESGDICTLKYFAEKNLTYHLGKKHSKKILQIPRRIVDLITYIE